MTSVIIKSPLITPFGRIKTINWDWKFPEKMVEFLPGETIGKIRIDGIRNIIIPIKIIPDDNTINAAIHPLSSGEITFWIKNSLFYHMNNCEMCLRYIIVHEFSHTIHQFKFPKPWEMRGFGKSIMLMTHNYFTDAIIDRWNVKNNNYSSNEPIESIIHIYGKNRVNLTIADREHLFESCMFFMRFASHCEMLKNNLYVLIKSFPYDLQNKYGRLLDVMSVDYKGSVFPIYRLIREIAELIMCRNQKEIITKEIERRFYTLSDIRRSWMHRMSKNLNEKKFHQICNELYIHPSQITNCIFDWNNTFRRISDASLNDYKIIDEFLSKSASINDFKYTYFMNNVL